MEIELSKLGKKLEEPSAVNELTADYANDFRKGIDINLGVGYVNDDTIPVKGMRVALKSISKNPAKYKSAFNYGGAEGAANLRKAIQDYYLRNKIGGLREEDFAQLKMLIGANGATSLLDAFSDVVKPGIVITADPYYYIYTDSLTRKGFEVISIPEDEEGISTELLRKKLKEINHKDISFFYIVTVNNPSGVVTSNTRRKEVVKLARKLSEETGRKIPVIFDKAYEDIIHNKKIEPPVSGLKYDEQGLVFEVGTLSKILSPALRVGYLLSFDHVFCKLLTQRTSDIGFSASLINQETAGWLLTHQIEDQRAHVNKGYREKAKLAKSAFEKYLGKYLIEYRGGDASFYFYLTLKKVETGRNSKFYNFLNRTTGKKEIDGHPEKNPRLVYIPGEICSKETYAAQQFRISYGFESNENLIRAIKLIAKACEYALGK